MARAFLVAASPEDSIRTERCRRLLCYKIASMIIGALTAVAATAGLAVSVSLLTLGMRPLREVVDLWRAPTHPLAAHAPALSATHTQHANGATRDAQDLSTYVFVGIVGFFLSVLGIPNVIHVVVSVELFFGAWHERPDMILQWIKFTQKNTALHAAFALLVVIALFVLQYNLLGALILGSLISCFVFVAFLVSVVHRFQALVTSQSHPSQVSLRSVRIESVEE